MKHFHLGQRVRGGPQIRRQRLYGGHTWQVPGWDKRMIEGIYVGLRLKQQGKVIYGGEEEPAIFKEDGPRIRVALIALDPRYNPIPVPFDTLEAIE